MPDISVLVKNKMAIGDGTKIICGNSDYIVCFSFDAEWDEYETKTMRVKYGGRSYTDFVFVGDRCALPIIADKACIEIGVFAGNLHTTSGAYFDCIGSIRCGAGAPTDPVPSVYDQIMAKLNSLDSVDPEDVAKAVADYLKENPVTVTETDPTVPEWAKAEKKPTYTAEEVGAEVYYVDLTGDYPNYTCPVAMADIKAAYEAGQVLECRCTMGKYTATLPLFIPMPSANTWVFSGAGALAAMSFPAQTLTIAIVNGAVQASNTRLATLDDISADLTLGLTGATVGQIAKIAAVDASGVPTAWSPVDVPTDETWEKLVDVTLAEDVEAVTYTFDRCKRLRALITPKISSNVSGWKRITINNTSYPALNGTISTYDGLCFRIDSEYPPFIQANLNVHWKPTATGINSGMYAAVLSNITPNGVTEFGCQTAAILTAGTKIEIWGVK